MKKGYVIILLLSGIIMPFVFLNAQNCLRDVTDGLPRASFFASGENGGEEYERAFNNDNNAGNKWYRGGLNTSLATPNWIGVNFGVGGGTAKILTGYLVSSANDFVGRNPRDWQFQGSNDGTNWLTLHTISNHSFSYSGQSRIFTFSNTTAYLQYRLLITETETTSESAVQIGEIELYENVCLEGFVRDAASTPLSGVTVAILGETYSIAGGGGSVFATATTDVTGKYRFDAASIPNGQFSLIVQPPAGYQVQQNAGPFFRDPTWANANQRFSLSQYLYTYDGSITFQNHLQLFQSGGTTGSVFWDNNEHSATYLNRFLPGFDKSSLNFILKQAQVTQVCATLLGSPGSSSNLITIADNGTFGSFDATSYLRVHPGQPGFSKDFNNTLLYTNGGLVNPTNTQYTYVNKANVGLGQGVLFDESRYTVSSFIGTIADLVDGTNAGTDATSLVNTRFTGWRKTFGTTTGDVYDKFLMVNGAGNNLPFFTQVGLNLKGNLPYLFSFDGKNANSTTQNLNTIVPVPYQLVNGSGTTVVSGTLNLPPPASVAEDNPSSAWNNLFATIIPPADGIYRLELRFPGGGTGNDFYIDNISLRSLTEYGDAPVAYGEAVHGQPANNLSSACEPLVVLGNRLDIENSNLSSPEADGDNTSNADDEDGVALPDLAPNATSYTAVVTASNRTATPATIYAWIDWDLNGSFDAGERLSVTVPPNTINNTYPLTWNTISTTAPVFARFRISSDVAAQNPSGIAVGGEVEDYKIPLGTVLAVNFGEITASFSNGELLVNWSTLKESNNSHFQVEVSADGKQFARVGEVKTQAENGNSSMSLNYSFSKTITANALQLGGGLMVLSMLILSLRRRRLRVVIVLMAALSLFLAGCMKKDSIDRAGERIFVRIVQVDQDGTRSYSKVIKAIMVNE